MRRRLRGAASALAVLAVLVAGAAQAGEGEGTDEEPASGGPEDATPAATPTPAPTDEGLVALRTESGELRVSGYLQSRFVKADGDASTFLIKRGRIKTTFTTPHTQMMVQVDATPGGIRFFDGHVGFTEPFSGQRIATLNVGVADVPFGYENPSSTPSMVFMERSQIVRTTLPGKKDLGAFLYVRWLALRVSAAVVNGQFVDPAYGNNDPTTPKNVMARAGVDLGWMRAGISGYVGEALFPDPAGTPDVTVRGDRNRYGADFGVTADLIPRIGSSTLMLELIQSRDLETDTRGGYVALLQELISGFTLGLRYSILDPDTAADNDGKTALDAALVYQLNKHFKVSAQGTLNYEDGPDVNNDEITVQIQGRY